MEGAAGGGAAPRLARRGLKVEGTLERMECGKQVRLHVRVGGAVKIFLIPDSAKAELRSGSGAALACGVQAPALAVKVEYQELQPGAAAGAAGMVRSLEFQ